jgi:hypothetical protein
LQNRSVMACAPLLAAVVACGQAPRVPRTAAESPAVAAQPASQIEVLGVRDDTPAGGDGQPRMSLAFRYADGRRVPIEGEATAYAPFRDGVALVDTQKQLVLVARDGARSVLARVAGAPPVRAPGGELVYVARHDLVAEVHVLDAGGRDRVVASGLADAGVLAPQPDGRLFFVAARNGGVAGVWLAERGAARCLTNCELETGTPWGDKFVPLPTGADAIRASAGRVEWDASDGSRRSVALTTPASVPAAEAGALQPGETGVTR